MLCHVTNSCELKLVVKRNHLVTKTSSISHKINEKNVCTATSSMTCKSQRSKNALAHFTSSSALQLDKIGFTSRSLNQTGQAGVYINTPRTAEAFLFKTGKKKTRSNKFLEMRKRHNVHCGVFKKNREHQLPNCCRYIIVHARQTDKVTNNFFSTPHIFVCVTPSCIDINVQTHTFTLRLRSALTEAVQRPRIGNGTAPSEIRLFGRFRFVLSVSMARS